MAQLAAWIPLVHLDKLFALPSQFILQHGCEHIPAIVCYGFTKAELATFLPEYLWQRSYRGYGDCHI